MKRKLLLSILLILALLTFTACGEDDYYSDFDEDYYDHFEDDYTYPSDDYEDDSGDDSPSPSTPSSPEDTCAHYLFESGGYNATCEFSGKSPTKKCILCDYKEDGTTIPPLGHDWVNVPEKAATPESNGYTAHKQCSRCQEIEGKEETVFVCTAHQFKTYPEKAATPSEKGHTAYRQCTICDHIEGYSETSYVYPCVGLLPSAYDRLSVFNLTEIAKKEIVGMYNAVMSFEEKYTFTAPISKTMLSEYYDILIYSLPETMMVYTEYRYNYKGELATAITFNYQMTQDEYLTKMTAVEKEVNTLLSAVKGKSDFEKIKYFHDQIIKKSTYSLEGDDIMNVYGTLVNGVNHCDGFSDAFNLLCNAAGIQCNTVVGMTTVRHAWNIFRLDGNWYYTDLTADNADFYDGATYVVFGATHDLITELGYTLEATYAPYVPSITKPLNISNRYTPKISAGQDTLTELNKISQEAAQGKYTHIYIHCETQEQFEVLRNNYKSTVGTALRKAYPNAGIKYMTQNGFKMVYMIVKN